MSKNNVIELSGQEAGNDPLIPSFSEKTPHLCIAKA